MAANGTCPGPMKATSQGAFQGENPLDYALPLAIVQICLVVVVTRGLAYLLRPLRQPRVIAEIIGGILLGPSALGRSHKFLNAVFPAQSMTVLDTLANIGLLFFLFLVGLELDISAIRRTGKKALAIALAGISAPFALGIGRNSSRPIGAGAEPQVLERRVPSSEHDGAGHAGEHRPALLPVPRRPRARHLRHPPHRPEGPRHRARRHQRPVRARHRHVVRVPCHHRQFIQ